MFLSLASACTGLPSCLHGIFCLVSQVSNGFFRVWACVDGPVQSCFQQELIHLCALRIVKQARLPLNTLLRVQEFGGCLLNWMTGGVRPETTCLCIHHAVSQKW